MIPAKDAVPEPSTVPPIGHCANSFGVSDQAVQFTVNLDRQLFSVRWLK
jgi:hypothetical protein